MRYANYSTQDERQAILDNLTSEEIVVGEENIELDDNGKPTINRLVIHDFVELADLRQAFAILTEGES